MQPGRASINKYGRRQKHLPACRSKFNKCELKAVRESRADKEFRG